MKHVLNVAGARVEVDRFGWATIRLGGRVVGRIRSRLRGKRRSWVVGGVEYESCGLAVRIYMQDNRLGPYARVNYGQVQTMI